MSAAENVLEDAPTIQMLFQRLFLTNQPFTLAYKDQRGPFSLLSLDTERLFTTMEPPQFETWRLAKGEKLAMSLEDRGFKYEAICHCAGLGDADGLSSTILSMPRTLRRADSHRLANFAPGTPSPCTFTNSRNAILEGQIKGFGMDGVELASRDPHQDIRESFRMGEESTLDVPLSGGLRFMAPAKVAYFGDDYVGLKFTSSIDADLLGKYQNWLEKQQQLQAQEDREQFSNLGTRRAPRILKPVALPQVKLWVDRSPAILVVTEEEEFARHMAEALGRKYGILSLDYIKDPLRPFLKDWGSDAENWGRVRLILIHNRLRLLSPLELTQQMVEQEKCPLPIVLVGTDEDVELKRNRALAAGAVDYFPVEPFKILSILKKLDETLQMFEG